MTKIKYFLELTEDEVRVLNTLMYDGMGTIYKGLSNMETIGAISEKEGREFIKKLSKYNRKYSWPLLHLVRFINGVLEPEFEERQLKNQTSEAIKAHEETKKERKDD